MVAQELNLPKKRIFKRPARFWKRLVAFILDMIVLQFVVILPFEGVFSGINANTWTEAFTAVENAAIPKSAYVALFFIAVLSLCYFAFFELHLRQTIGMTIMGLYVDGPLTIWKAFIRNLFIIPAFPFYILWIVEPLHLAFYRTRLLEKFTATSTVELLQAY